MKSSAYKYFVFKMVLCTFLTSAILSLNGCRRTFPDDVQPDEQLLKINLTFDVGSYPNTPMLVQLGSYTDGPISRQYSAPNIDDYSLRYTIDVYPENVTSPQVADRLDHVVRIIDRFDAGSNNLPVFITAPTQKAKVLIWLDFVHKGNNSDVYYNTSNLLAITMVQPYSGGSIGKSAFEGITVVDPESFTQLVNEVSVPMESPLAYYRIESMDAQAYNSQAGVTPLTQLGTAVSYQLWLPTSYNLFTQQVNDLNENMHYVTLANEVSSNSAILASDFVFTNKSNSTSTLTITLDFNTEGAGGVDVAQIQNIPVPLKRGNQTIIRGAFLTQPSGSGIAVDPIFDGNFNVDF